MIAVGLCTMGGCFAQDASTRAVDCYWVAECVTVPRYTAGTIGVYEHSEVPAGVRFEDCRVFTFQILREGNGSFFYVFQNGGTVYNAYGLELSNCRLELQRDDGAQLEAVQQDYPVKVEFFASQTGAAYPSYGLSVSPAVWNPLLPGSRLRILDARNGVKDFHVSHGQWGWKWYLLPMRSVLSTEAVFDFEEKVLVEL